jgi:hypothetical protein
VPLNAMGPIALFDKSFLQSLSTDEAVWFDHFFLAVVCPVFYVETLADLAKEPGKRTPEDVVRDISNKFPEKGGSPCAFHLNLCTGDLLGYRVPMTGQIPRQGARMVKTGAVFEQSAEEVAFQRWQKSEFYEVERLAAAQWRQQLGALDLNAIAKELRSLGIDGKSCKSLDQARDMVRLMVTGTTLPMARLKLATLFLQVPEQTHGDIIRRWSESGAKTIEQFAPYASFVLTIELFFHVALAANLIDAGRVSNRTDISYLCYLPFSNVFVSSDNLHRRCAHLFMRPDQELIWGYDLKAGLSATNAHFMKLPEEERDKGIFSFADVPPSDNYLGELCFRRMGKSAGEPKIEVPRDPEKDAELMRRFKEHRKAPTLAPGDPAVQKDPDMLAVSRLVRRKRGSWYQVPKDLVDTVDKDD